MLRTGGLWLRLLVPTLAWFASPGCERAGDTGATVTSAALKVRAAGAREDAGAEPVPEPLSPSEVRLWRSAGSGDPMDLQRLADQTGIEGLLMRVALGGEMGRIAAEAIPFAEGRGLVLGRLCRMLVGADVQKRTQVLRTIHQILTDPSPYAEPLEPENGDECRRALRLVLNDAPSPSEVDWAFSISERIGR